MALTAKANGALGGISLFSLTGSVLGWVGNLQTAKDLFALAQTDFITFNWTAILALVFFVSSGLLVGGNASFLISKYKSYKRKRTPVWNKPAREAIVYILKYSAFGKSLSLEPGNSELNFCMNVFLEAAKREKIRLAGIPVGSYQMRQIRPSELKHLIPVWGHAFELATKRGEPVFNSIITEDSYVRNEWPIS